MAMISKVLRMHPRDKKSVREIVKATSLARNTVRKYLRVEGVEERRRYQRPTVPSKLAPFVEAVKQALLVDAHRPKKERRTANALLKQISEAGYEGGYSRLTDFIREWRAARFRQPLSFGGRTRTSVASLKRVLRMWLTKFRTCARSDCPSIDIQLSPR